MKVNLIPIFILLLLNTAFANTSSENENLPTASDQLQTVSTTLLSFFFTIESETHTEVTEDTNSKETIQEEVKPISCREAIVAAQEELGNELDPQSFSVSTFADLNISVAELNNMSSSEQRVIYQKIMPMESILDLTLEEVNSVIDQYSGVLFAFIMADTLEIMKAHREKLKTCEIQNKL